MSVLLQIATWAKKLPGWQRDAVRRLLTLDSLADDEENELYAVLKAEHGLFHAEKKAPLPQPVADSFEPTADGSKAPLRGEAKPVASNETSVTCPYSLPI
jgi:hypothetical protein